MDNNLNKEGKWKTIAIVCIVLITLEVLFFSLGYYISNVEENQKNECYYNICENYIDAEIVKDICFCYEEDMLGGLKIGKEQWMR
jgi:hypothetical protein